MNIHFTIYLCDEHRNCKPSGIWFDGSPKGSPQVQVLHAAEGVHICGVQSCRYPAQWRLAAATATATATEAEGT